MSTRTHTSANSGGFRSRQGGPRRPLRKYVEQEAQLMLTTGSTRLAVSQGQQTW